MSLTLVKITSLRLAIAKLEKIYAPFSICTSCFLWQVLAVLTAGLSGLSVVNQVCLVEQVKCRLFKYFSLHRWDLLVNLKTPPINALIRMSKPAPLRQSQDQQPGYHQNDHHGEHPVGWTRPVLGRYGGSDIGVGGYRSLGGGG